MSRAEHAMLSLAPLGITTLALLGACARGEVGSATITGAPLPLAASEPTRVGEAAVRLADEVCKRKASCVASGPGGSSWQWVSTEDCIARERPRVEHMLGTWSASCTTVSAEARLEQCLPAMKTASCEPLFAGDDHHGRLTLCPTTETCIDPPAIPTPTPVIPAPR